MSLRLATLSLAVASLALGACLSSNPNAGNGSGAPAPAASPAVTVAAPVASASPAPEGTLTSQPQPGFNGRVIKGVVSFQGAAPPPGSTLYLGLAKSLTDAQARTCIDARRDPVNDVGQFYAQVACTPQPGDQLLYVLVIGPEGLRNWHRGIMPMPSDLSNVHIDVPAS